MNVQEITQVLEDHGDSALQKWRLLIMAELTMHGCPLMLLEGAGE